MIAKIEKAVILMEQVERKKLLLTILMVNMFITMVGIGLIIPILPKFLLEFGVGGQEMGYLVAAFALTQFLFSPVAGEMADRHGRRIIILLGIFIFSISQLIFAVGTEMWMLYISRLLGGIGAAFVVPPMMAYVADITTEDERGKGMGMLSAAMTLGFVIGPGVGGFLADFGLRVPLYCSAMIAGLATLTTFLFLKETLAKEDRLKMRVGEKKQENIFTQLVKSVKAPYFILLVLVFVLTLGLVNYEVIFGLFVDVKFGFTPKDISIVITVGALVATIVQAVLVAKLITRFGEKNVMNMSLLLAAVSMILLLFVKGFWTILIISVLFFIATALVRPAVNTLLSKMAGDEQGFVAGMNNAYMSIGNMIGPAVAGIVFDININIPYIFGAAILLGSIGIVTGWKGEKKEQNVQESC